MAGKRIKSRFLELLAEKSRKEGRRILRKEVYEATGLAKTTVDRYARNEIVMFDEKVLIALCGYFDCPLSGEDGLLVLDDESERESYAA